MSSKTINKYDPVKSTWGRYPKRSAFGKAAGRGADFPIRETFAPTATPDSKTASGDCSRAVCPVEEKQ